MSTPKSQSDWSAEHYTARSGYYDDSFHPSFARDLVDIAAPHLQPGSWVLDLACGTGLVTFLAAEKVKPDGSVLGIDASEGMLRVAREKLDKEELREVSLVHGDIADLSRVEELGGVKGSFDLITCASAFALLDKPLEALQQWSAFLKPGSGRIILDVPNPKNWRAGIILEHAARNLGMPIMYNRSWVADQDSLTNLVREAGFEVEINKFVEQTGSGTRRLPGTAEYAQQTFDGMNMQVVEAGGNVVELRKAFVDGWLVAREEDGMVEDVDGVWVVVARKL